MLVSFDISVRYILPNHFLFQLAEQPPADMASLLGLFRSSVPPVLKRRGKDLLDVIQARVKSGLALMNGGDIIVEADREVEVLVNPDENVIHEQEGVSLQLDSGGDNAKLWGKHEQMPSASSSSLFGSILPIHPTSANTLTTSISTLFGPVLSNHGASSGTSTKSENPHFKELLNKIHRTLVIVPVVPNFTPTAITGDNESMDSDANGVDPISGMQVEMPYVPASQRQSVRTAEETDAIVVVGQARQKKRKRTKAIASATDVTGVEHAATEKPQNSQAEDDDIETPFDFNAVPNILDDNPDTEDRKKKRQRKQAAKRGGTFYGDFPAPPKAHSELKSGNQSHTFK